MRPAENDELDEPHEKEPGEASFAKRLVRHAMAEATEAEPFERLLKQPLAWVIEAPSESWVDPIVEVIRELITRHISDTSHSSPHLFRSEAKTTTRRSTFLDDKAQIIAGEIALGKSVVGVAADPERQLPAILVRNFDRWIVAAKPTAADVARVLGEFYGEAVAADAIGTPDVLNLDSIAFAVRPGASLAETIRRLRGTAAAPPAQTSDGVPELSELAGYGAAKSWGLALARDIQRLRRGDPGISLKDLPKGILLEGPPGVGKSIFAMALAKTTQLPLETTSVSRWLSSGEGHLDDALKAARSAIEAARAHRPGLLMIDEIDSIVDRDSQEGRYAAWWINFVNGVLDLIDGTLRYPGLITIGACNNASRVDPALRRAGRLDKVVRIQLPNKADREVIFRCYLGQDLASDDLEPFAQMTEGMSGADIVRIVTEARQIARDASRELRVEDLAAAIAPPMNIEKELLWQTALHEAGHAVIACVLGLKVGAVQIGSSGDGIGLTNFSRRRRPMTFADIEDYVIVTLAGRAADEVLCGAADAGSGGVEASDLAVATSLLAGAHGSFGLGEKLTFLGAADQMASTLSSNEQLRFGVERDLVRLQQRAKDLVRRHRSEIEAVAAQLAERRFVRGDDVARLCREASLPGAEGLGDRRPA
ncbi:AAA family ATPase [Methylopila turkensis]|uniref:AAA+ ATPase domain-containing protein n=1 Tax=Methylopila turkensis TaxID=1437816 RepID=A0A9W6JQ70_9HYPH|nr:AAA family ATPase [Methylopila turkensis]GLK81750.1 hypothetical protein GCM10008174_34910 [Methylopila turkensis]